MSETSGQDKSFDASPEKKRKARKKGNVPNSTDLNVLLSYAGFLVGVTAVGGSAMAVVNILTYFTREPEYAAGAVLAGSVQFSDIPGPVLLALASLFIFPASLVVLGIIAQGAFVVAPSKIKPDLKKINPVEGIKRRYGPNGMSEFLKSAAKVGCIAIAGGFFLWGRRDFYLGSMGISPIDLLDGIRREILSVIGIACLIALAVAAVDVPLQRNSHARKLKMSRQEVTDEHKELEGDPSQKQARRRRAQDASSARMMRAVPDADVLIANPTHYAIVLKWDRSDETVPVCVAKGKDHLALSLINQARAHKVPVREDPPCARALFATVDVGEPIKPEHFLAVAAAIRFADAARS